MSTLALKAQPSLASSRIPTRTISPIRRAAKKQAVKKTRATRRTEPHSSIKLTRKGRFLFRGLPLLTILALLVLGAITLLNPSEVQAGESVSQVQATQEVQVKHGQTLWDIASETQGEADVRDVVNEIMKINDLTTVEIQSGQRLEVPVYTATSK